MSFEIDHDDHLQDLILKKVTIENYRGRKEPLVIELKPDANFLIGRNGTGKTTLINLVYDILAGRHQQLLRAPFRRAEVLFAHSDKRYSPTLIVSKDYDDENNIKGIVFSFRDYKSRGDSFSYYLRSRLYRSADDSNLATLQKLQKELSKRYHTTWLALNRSFGIRNTESDFNKQPTTDIDKKLLDTRTRLATYFTRLDNEFSAEVQKFQQQWLLSFLVEERQDIILRRINDLDFEEEKRHLTSMLKELKIPPEDYLPKVDRHISMAKKLASSDIANFGSFSKFANLYDISKLHRWVERWRILQDKRETIYFFKNKFFEKLNDMLFRKVAFTDSGNTLQIIFNGNTKGGSDLANMRGIDLTQLSSGEKQLIIFLAETLLKEKRPYIFLADEPELSLHIEWQEKLVPVILEISPQAQIFFATHSPDIVNKYSQNIFSMEELAY